MHYSTGTILAMGTIQSVLYRKEALFNWHHSVNMHYTIGTIPAMGAIQSALYRH